MLLRNEPPPPHSIDRRFRQSFLGDLIFLIVILGVTAAATRVMGPVADALPGLAWIVVGPILFISGLLWLLVCNHAGRAFFSSLRPTNWLAALDGSTLFLNLRSYQNDHFDGDAPTVVELPLREIAAALPNGAYEHWGDLTHFAPLEDPARIAAAIASALELT